MTISRAVRYVVLLALFVSVVVLVLYGTVVVSTRSYIQHDVTLAPAGDVALVLGASVYSNGALSPVLRSRADTAVALYKAKKVSKILVTGDNSSVGHNEVNPVGNYLLSLDIPKQDIFLDHAGFDTYSSMYRARDVFEVKTIIIVSQDFHLARAVYVARYLGINAYGMEAVSNGRFTYNWLREVPATMKALFDLTFARTPKYLGEKIPVTGDGSSTWADATTTPTQ